MTISPYAQPKIWEIAQFAYQNPEDRLVIVFSKEGVARAAYNLEPDSEYEIINSIALDAIRLLRAQNGAPLAPVKAEVFKGGLNEEPVLSYGMLFFI